MPGLSSDCILSLSASAETNAMNFPFGATLWVYEQQKTYLKRADQQKYHKWGLRNHSIKWWAVNLVIHQMKIVWAWDRAHMSELRPSCFCGKIIWTEWDSFVFGIGWLIIAIARATLPIFLTCWKAWAKHHHWKQCITKAPDEVVVNINFSRREGNNEDKRPNLD